MVLSFSRSASTLASEVSILIFESIKVSLPPEFLMLWFAFMMADRVSSGMLLPQACTYVHDFDEDKAEEENQSQHNIDTFEAMERSIKQSKGPCRSCMPKSPKESR